jgi:hypothetical protein
VAVWVDPLLDWGWSLGPSCHLLADTAEELHAFAARLGMRRSWFQDHGRIAHYDLTVRRRAAAVALGALELDRRDSVRRSCAAGVKRPGESQTLEPLGDRY